MARLRDDTVNLTRRGEVRSDRGRMRAVLPALVFVSIGLMVLSRLNHSAISDARWHVAQWMSPVLQAAMVPLAPVRHLGRQIAAQVDMADELQRLRDANQKLSNWEWRARELERKLENLEQLNRVVAQPNIDFITGRVIADSSGAFVRNVMIDVGNEQSVRAGYPVISADGLVGRVVEIGKSSSRVLLSTDLNSRIPVVVGASGVRAILAGDNGPEPRLIYVPAGAVIKPGDEVATSGTGGLFPRGLRIGAVAGGGVEPRVKLLARLDELEYLSVLFFESPTLDYLSDQGAGSPRAQIAPVRSPSARGDKAGTP
ncbi:MAG: rod shape-determining protein MreC [Hyphomicrobium sp.]